MFVTCERKKLICALQTKSSMNPNSIAQEAPSYNAMSLNSTSSNAAVPASEKYSDLQQLTPKAGRLGIEEIPFQGRNPVPQVVVPPPAGGWGPQATREDALQRFTNRSTQGIDGGGRSTNITRFTPQLVQWQRPDDLARHRHFERMQPSSAKVNVAPYV